MDDTQNDGITTMQSPPALAKRDAGVQLLTADEIFASSDVVEENISIPEWGGSVRVRSITKGQHRSGRKRATRNGEIDSDLLETELIVNGLVAPPLGRDEIARLQEKNAGAVEKILSAILRISGLTGEADADADRVFPD